MKPIKTCIVGLGRRGTKHLDRLIALDEFEVVGVADTADLLKFDPIEDTPLYEAHIYLFKEVDAEAVFICTPHHTHASICIAALEHGLRVFLEKPAAATMDDCGQMLRVEEQYDLPVAVGYHHMGHANAQWMKETGVSFLRDLQSIVVTIPLNRRDGYYEESDWLGRMKVDGKWCLDGVLMNQAIHYINQAMWFASNTVSNRYVNPSVDGTMESAMYKIRETSALETGDLAVFQCELVRGIKLFCVATTALKKSGIPIVKLIGNGGVGWYRDDYAMIRLDDGEHIVHNRPDEPDYLYHNFFDFVREGKDTFSTLDQAVFSVEVVEEAFKAVDFHIKDVSLEEGFDFRGLIEASTDRQCMFSELPDAPDWA